MRRRTSPPVPAKARTRSSDTDNGGSDSRPRAETPLTIAEARELFAPFEKERVLVLAVSGGPDSTALLWLAARWRAARKSGPDLLAVTVDHGLRKEAAAEARAVKALSLKLGVAHRTLRWTGDKPTAGLPQAARDARYRLLAGAAAKARASTLLTAHTLDDQAETVLLRLLRGSGPAGLQAMAAASPCPGAPSLVLARPLLDVPKARLIATLQKAGIGFASDPTNLDPHYTRPRLRALMPQLEREGLSAGRLALLARRLRRVETALNAAIAEARTRLVRGTWGEGSTIVLDRTAFEALPDEIAIRLLGQAIAQVGSEGLVELGKLESLHAALGTARGAFRRSLAGALVTRAAAELLIEKAPPRRQKSGNDASGRISALTTRKSPRSGAGRTG